MTAQGSDEATRHLRMTARMYRIVENKCGNEDRVMITEGTSLVEGEAKSCAVLS